MKYKLSTNVSEATKGDLLVLTATSKDGKASFGSHWNKNTKEALLSLKSGKSFKGEKGESVLFNNQDGTEFLALGLGEKSKLNSESLRKEMAKLFASLSKKLLH